MLDYSGEWLEGLPEEAIESFAGTGNPFYLGSLSSGQKVVDAGCGADLDCCIASKMVGSAGEVVGVDMTTEMIDKASGNARSTGVKNVAFKQGVIEELPVEDQWADVVISNGAIDLVPDKDAVFRELNRVLKSGGWVQLADILVEKPIPDSARRNIDLRPVESPTLCWKQSLHKRCRTPGLMISRFYGGETFLGMTPCKAPRSTSASWA